MEIGPIGIWMPRRFGPQAAGEIEALGFGALWLGSSPSVDDARAFLEASSTMVVATGILNVWQHEPAAVAAAEAEVHEVFPDRFLLGVGIGHPEATSDYTRPLSTMRAFFDGLEAHDGSTAGRRNRVLAALGPKMLDLAGERSLGTHPYFTTPDHTAFARARLGEDALVAPELAVVVEEDDAAARTIARDYASTYLGLKNYTNNLLRFGFTEDDLADGGSDRLIDAVVPHGSPTAIGEAVQEHLDAGADHVCLQPLGHGSPPLEDYRLLADALL
jgi:probable F420-dependent oxidoreductase